MTRGTCAGPPEPAAPLSFPSDGLLVAPAAVQAADIPPIDYRERVLDNGLRVLSGIDATTPNVTVQVWYGVGSKDDPQGRSGFAHLFEHMMFKATRNMPSETLDRMTEDVGGFNNASTWDDFTNYYEVVPANHLERLLWAEAERMGSLVVDAEIFDSERDVVKEELRQRIFAAPYGRLFGLMIPQASYQEHPYKSPGIGSIAELDAATIDDVRAFHRDYYRPDNAVLIIIGNFEPAALDAWVDKYFAPLKTPTAPQARASLKPRPSSPNAVASPVHSRSMQIKSKSNAASTATASPSTSSTANSPDSKTSATSSSIPVSAPMPTPSSSKAKSTACSSPPLWNAVSSSRKPQASPSTASVASKPSASSTKPNQTSPSLKNSSIQPSAACGWSRGKPPKPVDSKNSTTSTVPNDWH